MDLDGKCIECKWCEANKENPQQGFCRKNPPQGLVKKK